MGRPELLPALYASAQVTHVGEPKTLGCFDGLTRSVPAASEDDVVGVLVKPAKITIERCPVEVDVDRSLNRPGLVLLGSPNVECDSHGLRRDVDGCPSVDLSVDSGFEDVASPGWTSTALKYAIGEPSGGVTVVILDISTEDMPAFVHQIPTTSLSDQSYIVVVGAEAVAIDIQRDLDRFEAVLAEVDVPLVAVLETHIHNDYVSGGRRFADLHGAAYILPANSNAQYAHDCIQDGETVGVGGWVVRAMHTPGHTFNHMSYVLESPDGPVAIFSGGSMLVGSVGRSDLFGPDHTKELLASQFASVNRIANELPDPSLVAPTHGAGSFCASGGSVDSTSTISQEKLRNPALLAPSVEMFSMAQSMSMKMYPSYYRHMAPANLDTNDDPPTVDLPVFTSIEDVEDATIVDIRPFAEYSAGHIPGSLSFEVSDDAAVYMGWTLEWGSPLVLVGSVEQTETMRTHLVRIGWDNIVGRIRSEDIARFASSGLATIPTIDFRDLADMLPHPVLDVRDPIEHESGVVPGADLVHLSGVAARPDLYVDDGPIVVHCASGYRASIAAGFIAAAGGSPIVVVDSIANFEGTLAKPVV